MVFGCWWFLNNPSLIEEIERMRMELLGVSFIPAALRRADSGSAHLQMDAQPADSGEGADRQIRRPRRHRPGRHARRTSGAIKRF
jgi:hypothetical protein